MKKNNNDERYRWARQSGLLATIPFLMAVPPILGLLIGRFIDGKIGTNPVFTIVFMIFGFAAGVREVASVLKKSDTDEKKNKKQ